MDFKIIILFLFLFSGKLLYSQSLSMSPAPMSSGDRKTKLIGVGNRSNGQLCLLDVRGYLWFYDGYELKQWSKTKIKNPHFLEGLYFQDSILYAITEDALVSFDGISSVPKVVNKGIDQCFTRVGLDSYYISKSKPYLLSEGKLIRKNLDYFPTRKFHFVQDDCRDDFVISKASLLWRNETGKLISSLVNGGTTMLHVDFWNNKWLIKKNRLYRLSPKRDSYDNEFLSFEGEYPQEIVQSDLFIVARYSGNQLVKWTKSVINDRSMLSQKGFESQKIEHEINENIAKIIIDSNNELWVISEDKTIYFYNIDHWDSWSKSETWLKSIPISILVDDDIVSVVSASEGILQARKSAEREDWIWIPHRLNKKLKKLDIITAVKKGKQFIFTKKSGIYILDGKELGVMNKGIPKYGISNVQVDGSIAAILGVGKRWYLFDFLDPSPMKLIESESLVPEISTNNFLYSKNHIYYKSDGNLIDLSVDGNSNYYTWDFKSKLEHSFVEEDVLYAVTKKGLSSFTIPSEVKVNSIPYLEKVILLTDDGQEFLLYPRLNDDILVKSDQFPLKISVEASYLTAPKTIEYAWELGGESISSFQFTKQKKIHRLPVGMNDINLYLKQDKTEQLFELSSLKVEKVVEEVDYRWAIYLSAILLGVIGLLLIVARVRSKNHKRRIKQLEVEKRSLELEQKALQLQMNPHFIFNALNGIKGMIALGENKKARQYLTKVSGWMRSMLNDSRSDHISIGDEIKNLETYMDIERELRGNIWSYEIEVDDAIDRGSMIPPMMLQPFIENAIIHAFKGIDYTGKIFIVMKRKGMRIEVEIEDNGCGIQLSSTKDHKSVALEVIKDRLKILNKGTSLEEFSLVNKKDVKLGDRLGRGQSGVIVKLLLPILH